MPQLIDFIDKIARDKQRGVLFLMFSAAPCTKPTEYEPADDYEAHGSRQAILQWCRGNGIRVVPCGGVASENFMEGYSGQLYLDVPYDEQDPVYQALDAYLCHPDGTSRFPDVMFCYLPLEVAMKNAHHDEPGFWQRINY